MERVGLTIPRTQRINLKYATLAVPPTLVLIYQLAKASFHYIPSALAILKITHKGANLIKDSMPA